MASNVIDITGDRFGRLVAIRHVSGRRWLFKCDCGKEHVALKYNAQAGYSTSCGCFHKEDLRERNLRHGHALEHGSSKTYTCWRNIIQRTTNPKNSHWKYYGARGISICARWLESFENFLADMGEAPAGLTIDRIDVDGNYEPSNCRWADYVTQNTNKRKRAA